MAEITVHKLIDDKTYMTLCGETLWSKANQRWSDNWNIINCDECMARKYEMTFESKGKHDRNKTRYH